MAKYKQAEDKTDETQGSVMINIYDGAMQPFTTHALLNVQNGQDVRMPAKDVNAPNIYIHLPFHNGLGDEYSIVVSAKDYRDAGYFAKVDPHVVSEIKLVMIRKKPTFKFLSWQELTSKYPAISQFLTVGMDPSAAEARYVSVQKTKPRALACLLNLTVAMSEIDLGGKSPLAYFREICWDNTMAQDRFFGFVDPAIIPAVRAEAEKGAFAEEKTCAQFHPGSTHSWKQIAFDVANVQLTFHENNTKNIDGLTCVMIEPDIDDYKNLVDHGLLEVLPNLVTGGLTDPTGVYALRWTTAEDNAGPSFDPGYTLA
jgi:hypothetical protein